PVVPGRFRFSRRAEGSRGRSGAAQGRTSPGVTVGVPTPVTVLAAQSPGAQLTFTEDDRRHMARALGLAARGLFTTTPNPRVGCVIVRDGRVLGEGFHERAGLAHAEVAALADAHARGFD